MREGVTVLNQTPSAFYGLAAHTDTVDLPVRLLIFGGEPLDLHPVRRWLDHHRDTRAVNMFGITETTVHVTAYEICAGHQEEEVCPEANAEIGDRLGTSRITDLRTGCIIAAGAGRLHRRAVCGRTPSLLRVFR